MKSYLILICIGIGILNTGCWFSSDEDEMGALSVAEQSVEAVTYTTAVFQASVESVGNAAVEGRGVCWSVSPDPTLSDDYLEAGTDDFTVDITGLVANTTYYIRAFARNDAEIVYGPGIQFSTRSLDNTTWDISYFHHDNEPEPAWHADVIFYADGSAKYDEPDFPGVFTLYGTWELTGNEIYYDMDSSNLTFPDDQAYILTGTIEGLTMAGTYTFLGSADKEWSGVLRE